MQSLSKHTYFVYLGGSHQGDQSWRNDFEQNINLLTQKELFSIVGINPFQRSIDESDSQLIVGRDLTILSDERLRYIILKSSLENGFLSTGTACEMIIARSLGKPVIVLTDKVTKSGTTFVHPFTSHFASYVTNSIIDIVKYLIADIHSPKDHGILEEDIANGMQNFKYIEPDSDPFELLT